MLSRPCGLKSYYLGFGRGRKILSILLAPRSNSGITPVGLLERYKDTSSPPFIAPSVAAKPIEHPRTAGHLGSRRICLSVFVPLTAILQGSVKKKRTFLGAFAVLETRVYGALFAAWCTKNATSRRTQQPARLSSSAPFNSPPTLDSRLTALPLSTSARSRLSKLAIRLPLVWTARPRIRPWP